MSHVGRICSGSPVNLWFLRIRGKAVLNRYGNSSPPPKCPLKRGLVYHVCSRLNNMSVSGIRTTPSRLLLVRDGAPSRTPTPPLSQHPPPMSSLPSSAAVNNEWFPNCLSRFLLLTSDAGKTGLFPSVNILEDVIWPLIVVLFHGRNLLISCFSYPVLSSTAMAANVPPASKCKQPSGLLTQQMAMLQPSGAQWNTTMVLWKPIPPCRHTHSKPTFFTWKPFCLSIQTVWNGATEHKEADIRHSASSIADIEFCVTLIDLTVFFWTHLLLYFFIYISMHLFSNLQL